jgi:hypothetical protein
MHPMLYMILAQERIADLRRTAERERQASSSEEPRTKRLAPSYRLPNGSWIYRRRDSS